MQTQMAQTIIRSKHSKHATTTSVAGQYIVRVIRVEPGGTSVSKARTKTIEQANSRRNQLKEIQQF